jgi:hypothetical protein
MTSFQEREKAFEAKFARDEDLRFKAESRRNKLVAEWAAGELGLTGDAVADYIKAVRKADLAEKGDEDVVRKVMQDFSAKGLAITDDTVRAKLAECLAQAVEQIEKAG